MNCLLTVRVLGCIGLAVSGALPGCADPRVREGDDTVDGAGPHGWAEQLDEPTAFTLADAAGGSRVHITAVSLTDDRTEPVDLAVAGGILTLSLDDRERVGFHELLIAADDVMVSPSVVPPDGLILTDLTARLAEPVLSPSGSHGDDHLAARVELSIDLEWAVEVEHGVVHLAPIRLPSLGFDVAVQTDASGGLSAHLSAARRGIFWSWADIFELRDLEMTLLARAER
jgi:hypothetical protein